MSAKALKIEWLPIKQKFSILDCYRSHAKRFLIRIDTLPIMPQFHDTGIQIGVQRLPEMHPCDGELTSRSGTPGDGFACLILNGDANLLRSLGLDAVSYLCIRSLYLRSNGDIAYIDA